MRRDRLVALTAVLGVLLCASPAAAFQVMMDYTGFSWKSQAVGGVQRFEAVGVFDGFNPWIAKPGETTTFYLSNLLMTSEQNLGGGMYLRQYSGGRFSIYESTGPGNRPYSYGAFPIGGIPPASFVDGLFWLGGSLSSFTMLVDLPRGLGSYTGRGSYDGGSYHANLQDNTLFTFAGLTKSQQAGIPPGYEYRLDGQITANVTPIPEPGSLLLLGGGLVGAALMRRRRQGL